MMLLAVAMTGCTKRQPTAESTDAAPTAAEAPKVCVFTWQDYFSPEVCAQFTKETGIAIEWRYYENLGEMNALLRSEPDAFDVVIMDDMSLAEHIELKMLRNIEREKIPDLGNIDHRYLDLPFDPANRFSIPYMWGTTLVAYRKDKIPNPVESWDLLWDPALAGKINMLNERQDVYAAALLSMGLPLDSNDEDDLSKATEKLIAQMKVVDVMYSDLETIKAKLLSGDCWAALLYSGDAALIASEDAHISYFIPKEGAPLWLDSFSIPKESSRPTNAHSFINFMTKAESAAANANFLAYATANRAAMPHLNQDLREDETVFPPADVLARCGFIPKSDQVRDLATNQGMKRIFDLIHRREWVDGSGQVPANPPESISTDLVPGQ